MRDEKNERNLKETSLINREKISRLEKGERLSKEELTALLSSYTPEDRRFAGEKARKISQSCFGNGIYIRGLLEISNICKNDCLYCGIRRSNRQAPRYRLTPQEILEGCAWGYEAGFRTFVLQGGEDPFWDDRAVEDLVKRIKARFPDCAVTLSLGEKEKETYRRWFEAGADRYLLRHETACPEHYAKLHPPELSLAHRMQCLEDLKEIGYQTGCGCMVGSPYQTAEHLAQDLLYMQDFQPQMIGIGPFIPQGQTPFKAFPPGKLEDVLFLLSLIRLMHPRVLLPATTALGTIAPDGREQGILAGANVVMPNISPEEARKKYRLYDGKIESKGEIGESLRELRESFRSIGYEMVVGRGDYPGKEGTL